MEISFNNVTVYSNYKSKLQKKILSNVYLEIPKNKITAIYGDYNKKIIGQLICALETPSIGTIRVGNYVIKRNKYIKNINDLRFEVGYAPSDPRDFFFKKNVKSEIEYGMKHYRYRLNRIQERPTDALKLVGLDSSYEKRDPQKLSLSEQKKVVLASIIAYNPKIIILDEIEKGLNHLDRNNIIRLIKTLRNKYQRTIIIISNDIDFLFKCIDYIYVMKDSEIVFACEKKDLYNQDIERHIELPKIVDFIKKARSNGSKIEDYYEFNELIKGVYRDVK